APAARTELPQFHAVRIVLLILRRNIIAFFALGTGECHQNTVFFAFGGHTSPILSAFSFVATSYLRTPYIECHELRCMPTMRKRADANHSSLLYTIFQMTV